MTTDTSRRMGLASGLGFAVVGVAAGIITPPPPGADATAHTVRSYLTDHHRALAVAGILELCAPLVLIPFFVVLRKRFADADTGTAFLAFGIATSVVAVIGAVIQNVLFHGTAQLDDSALLAVFRLGRALFDIAPAVTSVGYLFAAAVGVAQTRDLPRWLSPVAGAVGVLAAVAGIIGAGTASGGPAALGVVGFLSNVAWIAAVSLTVLRVGAATPTPQPSYS